MAIPAVSATAENITREEMAGKVIETYEKVIGVDHMIAPNFSAPPFKDVKGTNEFLREIYLCFYMDYMVGTEDRIFEPNSYVTRAQAVSVIDRLISDLDKENLLSTNTNDAVKFSDDADICEWAKASVYRMRQRGFLFGDENNNFSPNEFISEEHVDSILDRVKKTVIDINT